MELQSIAAVVVGGTLLTGERGTILGTILGAFFLTAVRSEMIALGAPPSWYISFVGIALLRKMDELGFGNCRNHYECEAACPAEINAMFISRLNRDYVVAVTREAVAV
jgi:hypothetical protein